MMGHLKDPFVFSQEMLCSPVTSQPLGPRWLSHWSIRWKLDTYILLSIHKLSTGEQLLEINGKMASWKLFLVQAFCSCCEFSSVQVLSHVQLFVTQWTAAYQASLSIANSQSSLKLMPIESVMPSNHLIVCHPLFLPPSVFPSIRVFSNESALRIRWPNYWSFSFSISPSNEQPGLISFRMDWLALLAVQGTLKSLLQHHSSKHQFFGAQLSL